MKKQTAVEWLVEQLFKKSDIQYINGFDGLIEQAIAMEKEQIEAAYRAGYTDCSLDRFSDCEEYYNKNFNNTQS